MSTDAPSAPPSLWRHRPFLTLWGGETASAIGTQLAGLAIPVLAVTVLAATEFQVGVLGAVETLAFLVIGLPAGAWVDRMLKRRVMITADVVRAVALASVPVAFFAGWLTIWQLIIVGAIVGAATVFFDVAYQSYVPVLVAGELIGDANGKLETSQQIARVGGPALSGILLTIVRPAVLVGIDALSYVVSVIALLFVRDTEERAKPEDRKPLVQEIREGAAFVVRQPLLVRIVLCTAGSNLFSTIATTMLPVLVLRQLGISSALWGVAISVGAIGGLLGAMATSRLSKRVGEGTIIPLSAVVFGLPFFLLAIMPLVPSAAFVLLTVGEFVLSFSVLVYNIAQVTFRQRICPPRLMGRMNASIRFVVWGVMPIGGLASGILSTVLGVETTIWIGAIGSLLPAAFVVFSPLLGMRELPTQAEA